MESDSEEDDLIIATILVLRRRRTRVKKKRLWVGSIFKNRETQGHYHTLVNEMRFNDRECFFRYTRMSPDRFDHLLGLVDPLITKQTPN